MTLTQERIHALCFDVDGTLRDTDDQYVQRLAGWLSPMRLVLSQRDPLPFARRAVMAVEDPATYLHGLPDRLHLDHHLVRLTSALRRFRRSGAGVRHILMVPGIREMLGVLHKHYPMAVITARDEESTRTFLDHFELTGYFQAIASGQTCRYTKPFPDQILWAAQQLGVSPGACLMIGDTTVDIRAGKAAGAQTVGVLCGFGEEPELRRAGADLILPTTPDLADWLLNPPQNRVP